MSAITLSCNEFHRHDLIRACRILGASPLLSNEMVKSRDLLKSEHIRWASGRPLGCGSRRLNRAPPAAVARNQAKGCSTRSHPATAMALPQRLNVSAAAAPRRCDALGIQQSQPL